jgi:16S rRNA (guanine1207-N2)-methyltransferase
MSGSGADLRDRAQRERLKRELKADLRFADVLAGESLEFVTTWGLFSPRRVDDGTRLLLDHADVLATDRCLDLGCGYGPIGLTFARKAHQGHCTLVDKDFVAVEYSRRNAELNGLGECRLSAEQRLRSDYRTAVSTSSRPTSRRRSGGNSCTPTCSTPGTS